MKYLIIFIFIFSTPAYAQISVDNGIRNPKAMMVSGDSVIDENTSDNSDSLDEQSEIDLSILDGITEEDRKLIEDGREDSKIPAPILPESPSYPEEPKKNVRQVIKPVQQMKIRRSIADDRIDDSYVQEMIKTNDLFTNDYKTKNPNK
jgi:hypothetical protein